MPSLKVQHIFFKSEFQLLDPISIYLFTRWWAIAKSYEQPEGKNLLLPGKEHVEEHAMMMIRTDMVHSSILNWQWLAMLFSRARGAE